MTFNNFNEKGRVEVDVFFDFSDDGDNEQELEVVANYTPGRAPRVNPLLQARADILSGQKQKARLVCRQALMGLIADPSDYNRMARYHLQGLLFSQP